MRPHELESWVLSIIDRVEKGQPVEDSRVELKREWLKDPAKAARRLAGHANAAHGETILWVIGIDEGAGVVTGADHEELSSWHASVGSKFDELAPRLLKDLAVPHQGKTVVALLFESDRAPYVVTIPDGGAVTKEVPYRVATGIRSAQRHDLLTILSPLQKAPEVEIVHCEMTLTRNVKGAPRVPAPRYWGLTTDVYIIPKSAAALTMPRHQGHGYIRDPVSCETYQFGSVLYIAPLTSTPMTMGIIVNQPKETQSVNVEFSSSDAVLSGPAIVRVRGLWDKRKHPAGHEAVLDLVLTLGFAGLDQRATVECRLCLVSGSGSPYSVWRRQDGTPPQ